MESTIDVFLGKLRGCKRSDFSEQLWPAPVRNCSYSCCIGNTTINSMFNISRSKNYFLVKCSQLIVMWQTQANTQRYDNIVVRSQSCTTNTQSCSNVDVTTSKSQHCSNVAHSWVVALTHNILRQIQYIFTMSTLQRQIYNVVATLPQL